MDLKTLWKISYGLYIVASQKDDKVNGQITNTVFQLTAEPPTIGVSINKQNFTHECIMASRVFSVSILSQKTPMKFIGLFGFKCGRDINKCQYVQHNIGQTGAPLILENTIGYLECKVRTSIDVGTHTLFIGNLVDAEILNDETPMTYDYYHRVLKAKTPKTATTFIEEKARKEN